MDTLMIPNLVMVVNRTYGLWIPLVVDKAARLTKDYLNLRKQFGTVESGSLEPS
jgi:hypothetical protein